MLKLDIEKFVTENKLCLLSTECQGGFVETCTGKMGDGQINNICDTQLLMLTAFEHPINYVSG